MGTERTVRVTCYAPGRRTGVVTNGWSVGSILTVQSGLPYNPVISTNRSNSGVNGGAGGNGGGFDRPNWVVGRDPYNSSNGVSTGCGSGATRDNGGTAIAPGTPIGTPTLFYDPCAFALPAAGHLGNTPRDYLTGPGLTNVDFSVRKNTKLRFLGEAGNLEFRSEFFNIFNHPNFGMPKNQIFSGSSSTPINTSGQITNTATRSRQIQFSLRVAF